MPWPWLKPSQGSARYGIVVRNGLSFEFTPSPTAIVPFERSTERSTSVTSACSLLGAAPYEIGRPFGKRESMPRSTRSTSPVEVSGMLWPLAVRLMVSMMSRRFDLSESTVF